MRALIITILAITIPFFVSSCNESENTKPAKTVDLKSIIKKIIQVEMLIGLVQTK